MRFFLLFSLHFGQIKGVGCFQQDAQLRAQQRVERSDEILFRKKLLQPDAVASFFTEMWAGINERIV